MMSDSLELADPDLEDLDIEDDDATARRRSAIADIAPGADWNPIEQALLTRRSIRRFKGRQVPAHLIRRILEVGRFAPSQGNCQPWSFVVVRDKPMIAQMEQYCVAICKAVAVRTDYAGHPVPMTAMKSIAQGRFTVFHKAPTVILILMDKRGVGSPEVDIGVVGTNIVMAAQSLGLGTCWIGFSKLLSSNQALCERLGVASPYEIGEAIVVGYPIGNPAEHPVSRQTHEIAWWEGGEKQILF
jgi:nitroreductase